MRAFRFLGGLLLGCAFLAAVLVLAHAIEHAYPPRALAQGQGQLGSDGIGTRVELYHVAAPGANMAIVTKDAAGNTVTTGITAGSTHSVFRLQVVLATASVFNATATDGTTKKTIHLNGGVALVAGTMYAFEFFVSNVAPKQDQNATPAALKWNFEVETDGEVVQLHVSEVSGPVS